jgi:hypothetical protein
MKRRTFKSQSANPKTSSGSGGSGKTGGTAEMPTNGRRVGGRYATATKKINGISPAEFRRTLVRLGISNPNGKLAAKYATKV